MFFKFTTVNSTGAPAAFSSGGVTVYKDGSTVQDTTGLVLTSTFDTFVGLNHVTVSMAATSAFYAPGGEFTAIISSGAASENLAGYVLDKWSVKRGTPVTVSTAVSISTASVIQEVTSVTDGSTLTIAQLNALSTATHAEIYAKSTEVQALDNANSTATDGLIGGLENISAAAVNAEVVDVLYADSTGMQVGAPPASNSIAGKVGYNYGALIHGLRLGSSGKTFLNASSAVGWVKGIGDDGSTYFETRGTTST